jgi:tetratricopeptide (TPR) repeat protein
LPAELPFFPQEDHQCGPAALATVLGWSGAAVAPEQLSEQVFIPARQGSLQAEMLAAPARHARLAVQLPQTPHALLDELSAGHPVLVLQNLGLATHPQWHYAVLAAVDPATDTVTLRSGRIREHVLGWRTFLATWQRAGSWAMVVLRPGQLPVSATAEAYIRGVLALERAGQPAAAEAAYVAGLARWPDELLLPFGLANARYAQHDLAGAEQALRLALQIDPEAMPVLNNLAQVLIEQGCPTLAVRYAERALERAGERADQVRATLEQAQRASRMPGDCRRSAISGEAS